MTNDKMTIANELIAKGKKLKDPSLILMGYALLDEQTSASYYKCKECGEQIDIDRPNRKKCPSCGKFGLEVIEIRADTELEKAEPVPNVIQQPDYITTVRKNDYNQPFVDENGVEHKYARTEQINTNRTRVNTFIDDKTEGVDKSNLVLKKFTKIVKPTKSKIHMVNVVCDVCGKKETILPIHAGGEIYKCIKCLRRVHR